LIAKAMSGRHRSSNKIIYQAVRRGLADLAPQVDEQPFRVRARALGLRAGIDPARLNQLNDDLETDAFLTVTARLQQGDEQPS
jgi:hypothetical protein